MENQEKKCCAGGMKCHWKRIIVKVVILLVGIAIGIAIGTHMRQGRFPMMGGAPRGAIMQNRGFGNGGDRGDFRKTATGGAQTNLSSLSTLQTDYVSLMSFIQRGDITSATARIDLVTSELNKLKTELPTLSALTK